MSTGPARQAWNGIARLDVGTWLLAALLTLVGVAAIAIPTRLIPTGFFQRMTPARPLDYLFLVAAAPLVGLTGAIALRQRDGKERSSAVAGLATALAVGCPVCNKVVVSLIGVSGALGIWAPLQPALGAAALVLLAYTLRMQLTRSAPQCRLQATEPA